MTAAPSVKISAPRDRAALSEVVSSNQFVDLAYQHLMYALEQITKRHATVEAAAAGEVSAAGFDDLIIAFLHVANIATNARDAMTAALIVEQVGTRRPVDECVSVIAKAIRAYPDHEKRLAMLLNNLVSGHDLRDCFSVNELSSFTYHYAISAYPAAQFLRFLPRYAPPLTQSQVAFVEVLLEDWRGSLFDAIDTARLLRPPRATTL